MPTPVNTTLDVLLLAAQNKLLSDGVFAINNCYIAVKPDLLIFPPGPICVLTPGRQKIDETIRVGAGRYIIVVDGLMTVSIWQAVDLDQTPRDATFLTDAALGIITLVTSMINSLELYQPLDVNGNQLMPYGFELISMDQYSREINGVGWGGITSTFSMEYSLNIANAPTP